MFLIEAINTDNRTELIIYSRDENGVKKTEKVSNFLPYFYVPEQEELPDDRRITKVETGYKSLTGESVKKVYTQKANDINDVRNMFRRHYEADIPFTSRYLIDVLGEQKPYPLRIVTLDIETDSDAEFPNVDNPDQAITVISLHDNFSEKTTTLFYQHKDAPIKIEEDKEKDIRVFYSEEAMLNAFIMYIREVDPDILSGWYVDKFDLTYIINRMKQFEIDARKLSPLNFIKISEKYGDVTIKGRIVIDGMKAYKKYRGITNQGAAESYSLEFTSQHLFGAGKIEHKDFFHDMWFNTPDKLIEYNRRDTELVAEIEKKIKVVEFFNSIRCRACTQINDIYYTTMLVDGLLLRRCLGKVVLPSKVKNPPFKYSGAHVFEPIPGIYNYVIALDVKAMYPNLIKTFNIGYETFNSEGGIKLYDNIGFEHGSGLISETVRSLEGERSHYKKLMREATNDFDRKINHQRQYGVKVLANCFSGDTEILTPDGLKNIKDFSVGDIVYSINPKTHELEQKKVTKTIKQQHRGNMCHFKTQNMDLLVTPNHRMLIETDKGKTKFVEAKNYNCNHTQIPLHKKKDKDFLPPFINIINRSNNKYEDFDFFLFKNKDMRTVRTELKEILKDDFELKKHSFKKCKIICSKRDLRKLFIAGYDIRARHKRSSNCSFTPVYVDTKKFSSLLGWLLSEGSIYKSLTKKYSNGNIRGVTKTINISQSRIKNRKNYEEIIALLNSLKIKFSLREKSISFCSDMWFDLLELCGKYSYEKHVPSIIFKKELDYESFFSSLYKGDGHKKINKYTTNSEKLKNQVIIILTELGFKTWWLKDGDGCFRIKFHQKNWKPHKQNIAVVKNYNDYVYCVTVEDNHTVLAGRNGKLTWTGQSIYGYLGAPNSRLYRKEVAEAITTMGRKAIMWAAEVLTKKGYTIVYGDTDSVYVKSSKNDMFGALAEGQELMQLINKSYKDFSKQYGAEECTLEMEFEKLLKSVVFVGKKGDDEKGAKKRYAYITCWEDGKPTTGKIQYTGFDAKRSDTPRIAKELQKEVIQMMLEGKSKEDVVVYLKTIDTMIRNRKIPDEEFGFPKGISESLHKYGVEKTDDETGKIRKSGTPPVVHGCRYSNKYLGTRFSQGSKPKWIYVKSVPKGFPKTHVISYEEFIPDGFVPDFDIMLKKMIVEKVDSLFKAAGWGDVPELNASIKSIDEWL